MVKCNLFLTVKLNFQPSSLQSSVSHDLSEIILKCCYSTYFPISKFFSCLSQKFLARTNCNVDQSVCWQSSLATQEQDFPYPRFALMFFILLLNPWIYRSTSFSPHVSALNHLPQTCSFLSFFHSCSHSRSCFLSNGSPFIRQVHVTAKVFWGLWKRELMRVFILMVQLP